jgi:hypothetical protein
MVNDKFIQRLWRQEDQSWEKSENNAQTSSLLIKTTAFTGFYDIDGKINKEFLGMFHVASWIWCA